MRKLITMISFICCATLVIAQNARVEKDGFKWNPYTEYFRIGAKSPNGGIIVPAKYNTCYYERGHFAVQNNQGRGIVSKEGRIIVPAIYSIIYEIEELGEKSPYVVVGADGFGLYSNSGKLLFPAQYRYIKTYNTSKGLYFVITGKNAYNGVADAQGNWIIKPTKYNGVVVEDLKGSIYFSYMVYGEKRCSGICDVNGNVIIETKYTAMRPSLDNNNNLYYKIQCGNSIGTMDLNGNVTKKPTCPSYYYKIFGKKTMYLVVDENFRWGLADASKKMLIQCKYDFITLEYPYITVKKGNYMGLYDENCTPIVPESHNYVAVAKTGENDIGGIGENGKMALFDLQGNKLIDAIYPIVASHVFNANSSRKDTVLYYSENGLWGVETLRHKTIFPARYDNIGFNEFSIGNYFSVFKNNMLGLCDSKGQEIIEPLWSKIELRKAKNKDFFYATNGEYAAVFNVDGTQLINGETFSYIMYDENSSQFIATKGKRKCYFSKDGVLLSDNSLDIEQDKYISIADDYFERGKYKSAAKNYGLAINIKPTASLYYNRGVSHFNAHKYNDAISDFKRCLDTNPSNRLKNSSLELIDEAESLQIQKEQRQTQIASAIFGLALTGANIYFQIQAQKQQTKYSAKNRSSYTSQYGGDTSYNDEQDDVTGDKSGQCPSVKIARGKWSCANTGKCGMCWGDGLMDGEVSGNGANSLKCTLCGGSGKCKYCN